MAVIATSGGKANVAGLQPMSDIGRPCFIVYGMPKPNTTRYTLRLPEDLKAAINATAEHRRMTAAEVVRAAVEAYTASLRTTP